MKNILGFFLSLVSTSVLCQDGQLDYSFNPYVNLNNSVISIAEQNDNKILIGGSFGSNNNNIKRLNVDGTTDTSFGAVINFPIVNDIFVQNNNKIVVVGRSPSYIKRLNENGSLDATFNFPGATINGWINKVVVLNNGKIIIAGIFNQIGNIPREAVARLNPNGSLDTSFNLNLPPVTGIRAMDVQPDGKILIAGQNDETSNQYRIFRRYLQNGTLDTSFNGDEEHYIYDIKTQQDGKIMISGPFDDYSNIIRYNVARLNNDGTLDPTFDSYNIPQNGSIYTIFDIAILDDGKYIINGSFSTYDQVTSNYIAKINHDGTIDTSFNIGLGPNDFVYETYVQQDGKILIGGNFTTYNGNSINRIARLDNSLLSTDPYLLGDSITIYPNPTKDKVDIRLDNGLETESILTIYSSTGQLLKVEEFTNRKTIDLSFLTSGMYVFCIKNGTQINTYKILKQ
jgi:uncharacterized delta-60 repeat protein